MYVKKSIQMRWPRIELGFIASKATMLTFIRTTPKTLSVIHLDNVNLPNFLILENAAIMRGNQINTGLSGS